MVKTFNKILYCSVNRQVSYISNIGVVYCSADNIPYATLRPALIGVAGRIGVFAAPLRIFHVFFVCRASPISGTRIIVPAVLAHNEGQERIGEVRKCLRRASLFATELAHH